jgi:hypothetical protein
MVILPASPDDSIGFRIDDGDWQIYSGPFNPHKASQIQAKSVRYGWAESPVVSVSLQ